MLVPSDDSLHRAPDGVILADQCEVPVTHHCNLSCRSCTHISPHATRFFASPDVVYADLSLLARVYRARRVRLLGGEPLVHKDLLSVVSAVRASGVAQHLEIVTNGMLLPRMGAEFWEAIDEVQISEYPGSELSVQHQRDCAERARAHDVTLLIRSYRYFREANLPVRNGSGSLVRRIYGTCKIAHRWRCHTVDAGHVFKCPQSLFIPFILKRIKSPERFVDGLEISGDKTFGDRLWAYLRSPEPLDSCWNCLGTVGRRFPHEQEPRNLVRSWSPAAPALVDSALLSALEADPDAHDGCVTQERVLADAARDPQTR